MCIRDRLILTTKDKPTDRMDDPFLVEKMCAELEGILLWCLEGPVSYTHLDVYKRQGYPVCLGHGYGHAPVRCHY